MRSILCLLLSGHSQPPSTIDALLAQCTIESFSDTGRYFLKENSSQGDRDSAYRNWMLLCIKAKGFVYSHKKCPPAKDGALQASETRCYEKL
jgi:hypothetical protein